MPWAVGEHARSLPRLLCKVREAYKDDVDEHTPILEAVATEALLEGVVGIADTLLDEPLVVESNELSLVRPPQLRLEILPKKICQIKGAGHEDHVSKVDQLDPLERLSKLIAEEDVIEVHVSMAHRMWRLVELAHHVSDVLLDDAALREDRIVDVAEAPERLDPPHGIDECMDEESAIVRRRL